MPCIDQILCGKRTIIGIRNFVECSKPESFLWLNDYPGIDLKTASKITGDELVTGNKAMQECINNAVKFVHSDIMNFINAKFRFNNIVETRQTDENFGTDILPAANLERGRVLKRWRSEFAKIHLQEIYVKPTADCVVDFLVYDGGAVTTYPNVTLKKNVKNTVVLNYVAVSEEIRVVFNQSVTGVYSCTELASRRYSCNLCGGRRGNTDFVLRGWNGSKEDEKCYGIEVLAFIRCYEEDVFCSLLRNLHLPIYYRSVIEFMNMRIHSNRVNNVVTFGEEKAREIKKEAEELYNSKMKFVINNSKAFLQSTKGDCLTCSSSQYVQATP
jgi:hypothetical protein